MIYFLKVSPDGPVKIGWSKNVARRLAQIRVNQAHPVEIIRQFESPPWVEGWLHAHFSESRMEGEWFSYRPDMLIVEPPAEQPAVIKRRMIKKSGLYRNKAHINGKSRQIAVRWPNEIVEAAEARAKASGLTIARALVEAAWKGFGLFTVKAIDPVQDAKPVTRRAESQGEPAGRTGSAHLPTGAIPRHDIAAQVHTMGADSLLPPSLQVMTEMPAREVRQRDISKKTGRKS